MQVFNKTAALELLDNDASLLEILINSFLEENKFEKDEAERLIESRRLEEAASYVHATKGAARQLCLEKLQVSGQSLEDVLRGKKEGDVSALLNQMLCDYKEAVSFLKAERLS